MTVDTIPKHKCFLAVPYDKKFAPVLEAVKRGVSKAGFETKLMDDIPVIPGKSLKDTLSDGVRHADIIIGDVSDNNLNVFFELGLAQGIGKILLLISDSEKIMLPFDLRDHRVITYRKDASGLELLARKIKQSLEEYDRNPYRFTPAGTPQDMPAFFTDLEKLNAREVENLCRELLSQLGFQEISWENKLPGFEMKAEFHRRDPDGFDYKERWLISFTHPEKKAVNNELPNIVLDLKTLETRTTLSTRYIGNIVRKGWINKKHTDFTAPTTLLFIAYRTDKECTAINKSYEYYMKARISHVRFAPDLRLRVWDQSYLASLINRFPQIGYKYFSEEARIRSQTRKSYEELYKENSGLIARQALLIEELEDEKNRRIRAERDSVWKDISFSAAHKIGNPLFAIETDLEPLMKRIQEQRTGEAGEVVENIRSSLEKAKGFVEQFKSLARAQEIRPVPIPLRPILEDACIPLRNKDIEYSVECPEDVMVLGDPDRLAECFDELVANSVQWMDKPQKKLAVKAFIPAPEPLPDDLDPALPYVMVQVQDNGPGIPASDKHSIFEAFITSSSQGTGLGLALVRRIIDGHGGTIMELGIPGKGANFELFLPLPEGIKKKKTVKRRKKKSPSAPTDSGKPGKKK